MPCFGCFRHGDKIAENKNMEMIRASVTTSLTEGFDKSGARRHNALVLHKQLLLMPNQLSEATYGLVVKGLEERNYTAQDFFTFYEILGGGMSGVVFRVVFKPNNRELAVKFVPNYRQYKQKIMREIEVLKTVKGTRFMVDYHSHFRVGRNLYIVTEIYKGGNLYNFLSPKLTLTPILSRIYLKEIASALFFLHKFKFAHRDLNPGNIVLRKNCHLVVIDFGLARKINDPKGRLLTDCGHPAYRAPEVYLDKQCTLAVDWWSVGILLYRFVTGQCPFQTEKLVEGFQSVTKLSVKFPEWAFSDPQALNLCQSLLVKKPKHRLGYATEDEIKRHPYFYPLDWNAEENISEIVKKEMLKSDRDRYCNLYEKIFETLGEVQPKTDRASLAHDLTGGFGIMSMIKSKSNLSNR